MKIKIFLKNNFVTKYPYMFLHKWKHFGFKVALKKSIIRIFNMEPEKKNELIDNRSYKLPELLLENKNGKTLEIISCAFRKHQPQKGLTGGPNGVLATEKEIFGDIYHGIRMRYLFHSKNVIYPEHLEKALKGYSFMVKINFYAAYYLEYCVTAWSRMNNTTDFFFICHDLGFAYGAFLRKCKYVLIWHTQGSMINERESFGEVLSEKDKRLLNKLEEIVFQNAEAVYFPSCGAKESYLKTSYIDISRVNFAKEPLYNTIMPKPYNLDTHNLIKKLSLNEVDKSSTDIFLSVGDFSENKGMERVPPILNKYVEMSGKKVYWIAIGSKHKAGIYEKLCSEKDTWKFESSLFGERVDHDTLLALMEYTDYYIMMQRHSIFDLSTLEAMRAGKALILSNVGGNIEVNKENNVILVDEDNLETSVTKLKNTNKKELGLLNAKVFENYFSETCFFNSYAAMMDEMARKKGIVFNRESVINRRELSAWKNRYQGKKAIICGAGASLDNYVPDSNAVHFALNSALFYDKIKFDFLFMQDYPRNQKYTMDDYNHYDCIKFYGIITNPGTNHLSLNKYEYSQDISQKIIHYELAPMWYDSRVDEVNFDIDAHCLVDAKSVSFSAIQFAVFAGFKEIVLYGVDFSNKNFGHLKNPNKYADSVESNMISFKKIIKRKYPDIVFTFGSTYNENMKKSFEEIDLSYTN